MKASFIKMLGVSSMALSFGIVGAHEAHDHSKHTEAAEGSITEEKRIGDAWPLATCVVSGQPLGSMGDPIIKLHEGREVRFCCAGCVAPFEKDPAKFLTKADETITAQQKDSFPLDYCIVDTEEKLSGDEAKDSYHVIGNRLFIFCCPPCADDVKADPEKYFKTLDDAAVEKQKEDYPLEVCVVSGEELGTMGEAIAHVHGGDLYQFCCPPCVDLFEKDPVRYSAKLDEARAAQGRDGSSEEAAPAQEPAASHKH